MKRKSDIVKLSLKLTIVGLCFAGFITQTVQFLFHYWTYPTVLDIQESIPLETELPAITFCNINGFNPVMTCKLKAMCLRYPALSYGRHMCEALPPICIDKGKPPKDYVMVSMTRFFQENRLNTSLLESLKTPLKSLLNCKIVQGATKTDCDLDDITIASYFSTYSTMNICYTMNSLWNNPTKELKKIGKYDKIVMEFFVDMAGRGRIDDIDEMQLPKSNLPTTNAAINLAIHSPYTMTSPLVSGAGFLGGKQYKIKLNREDKHLLPSPYQTNCTDYMQSWFKNGGVGPLNQIMALEECKFRSILERRNCVPITIDYPHNETICNNCPACESDELKEMAEIVDNCSEQLRSYNQPCDFTTYTMDINEKMIFVEKELKYLDKNETENEAHILLQFENLVSNIHDSKVILRNVVLTQKGHKCTKYSDAWKVKCEVIEIEIVFDDLLVTNITYNPKIESLQLFSMIGGYMGLYLGVSFVAMYDLVELLFVKLHTFLHSKPTRIKRIRKNKVFVSIRKENGNFMRRRFRSPKQRW